MRVHVLHVGDTKVPFGQFYGGIGDEWQGVRGTVRFLRDKSHFMMVPIYAFLVEHPDHGALLVDTGINWGQAHDHDAYYDGPLLRASLDEDEYSLTRDQELLTQLSGRGLTAGDIDTVALTHLHEDHLGGVRDLPGARFLVSRQDWTARHLGIFPLRRTPSLKGVLTDPELVDFHSGPFRSFPASHDVFGDGSVRLLPTPGHTPGHLSVLVDAGNWQLLCTGDTLYTLRHLATDQVRPIMLGDKARSRQLDSVAKIQTLRREHPDLVLAPAHDHTEYGRLLASTLQGEPTSADLQELRALATSMVDEDNRLRGPGPTYLPGDKSSNNGTVTFT